MRDTKLLIDTKNPTEGSVTKRDRDFLDRQLTERSLQGILTTVPGMNSLASASTSTRRKL